jgi:two-component system, OmpR family, KDP operon response regulator KdpE
MTMAPRVLVVDDDVAVQRLLKIVLSREAYEVKVASSGSEALAVAREHPPSLVILALRLPELDGLEVCRKLRAWSKAPILVLTDINHVETKIEVLDLGADDYVTKPFTSGELLARMRALLRRSASPMITQSTIHAGDIEVDLAQREIRVAGEPKRLTRTEFDIVAFLAKNGGAVADSRIIINNVWGSEYFAGPETLRVHVAHLRKKIEPNPALPRYIITEPGIGYRLKLNH